MFPRTADLGISRKKSWDKCNPRHRYMWNVIQSNVVWQKVYYPSIFDKYFKQKIPGVYSCL